MNRLMKIIVKAIEAILLYGIGGYFYKVFNGLSAGQVSLNTPLNEIGIFFFADWFWMVLIVYGLMYLIPFLYKKIQHQNAERQRIKSEKRKQEIRDVLKELNIG